MEERHFKHKMRVTCNIMPIPRLTAALFYLWAHDNNLNKSAVQALRNLWKWQIAKS
jgi:hypothetical protein